MREAYHERLGEFRARISELAELAEIAMVEATTALLEDDFSRAAKVTGQEGFITEQHHQLDADALVLLAREQPVATDLRVVVAGLRMSSDLDRMGTLARHVAELVERRHPGKLPEFAQPAVLTMGELARRMAAGAREAIAAVDAEAASRLARDDAGMDRLRAMLAQQTVRARPDTATAMDLALLGRYYERFADHAVSLARRVVFITGGA
ncbi:MAG TPA: phosphate signaling complex protein PhoU [Amycolatopsis sp.]|jgi:phosphate transport system protein|nr:phosphate signaling complex protein PhoU [Amycolatopsis sp.]